MKLTRRQFNSMTAALAAAPCLSSSSAVASTEPAREVEEPYYTLLRSLAVSVRQESRYTGLSILHDNGKPSGIRSEKLGQDFDLEVLKELVHDRAIYLTLEQDGRPFAAVDLWDEGKHGRISDWLEGRNTTPVIAGVGIKYENSYASLKRRYGATPVNGFKIEI